MEKNVVNEVLLRYLILNGSLVIRESHYGDSVDHAGAAKIRESLDKYLAEIDWQKSEAPQADEESRFAGTNCDADTVHFLKAVIYHRGRKKPDTWKLTFYEAPNLADVILMVVEFMRSKA